MERELSLTIQSPERGQFLKHIEWNKDDFTKLISGIMEQYKGVVFTEDQIKEAKQDRARLNAVKKAISERRIQIKNEIMAPYTLFEAEVGEVVALIDGPISEIDAQIKEFEERQKTEKKDALYEHYKKISEDLGETVDFEMLFDKKYLNVSVSLARAKKDIGDKVARIRLDLANINEVDVEYRLIVKDVYLRTLDIGKAYGEMHRLKDMKRREQEYQEAVARQKAIDHEKETRKASEAAVVEETKTATEQEVRCDSKLPEDKCETGCAAPPRYDGGSSGLDAAKPEAQDPFVARKKLFKSSFTIYGTREEIMSVRQYMVERNIRFERVEQK